VWARRKDHLRRFTNPTCARAGQNDRQQGLAFLLSADPKYSTVGFSFPKLHRAESDDDDNGDDDSLSLRDGRWSVETLNREYGHGTLVGRREGRWQS
jgi:hypothetical protein